jgi:hypothetical protein
MPLSLFSPSRADLLCSGRRIHGAQVGGRLRCSTCSGALTKTSPWPRRSSLRSRSGSSCSRSYSGRSCKSARGIAWSASQWGCFGESVPLAGLSWRGYRPEHQNQLRRGLAEGARRADTRHGSLPRGRQLCGGQGDPTAGPAPLWFRCGDVSVKRLVSLLGSRDAGRKVSLGLPCPRPGKWPDGAGGDRLGIVGHSPPTNARRFGE